MLVTMSRLMMLKVFKVDVAYLMDFMCSFTLQCFTKGIDMIWFGNQAKQGGVHFN